MPVQAPNACSIGCPDLPYTFSRKALKMKDSKNTLLILLGAAVLTTGCSGSSEEGTPGAKGGHRSASRKANAAAEREKVISVTIPKIESQVKEYSADAREAQDCSGQEFITKAKLVLEKYSACIDVRIQLLRDAKTWCPHPRDKRDVDHGIHALKFAKAAIAVQKRRNNEAQLRQMIGNLIRSEDDDLCGLETLKTYLQDY